MILQVDIAWPTSIPLPSLDFSGAPRNSTLVSPEESATIVRRSRFQRSYSMLSVGWVLTEAQYQDLCDFFLGDLGNGTAQFKIELRYPKNSELTEWSVRFGGGYEASREEGYWTVRASLELVNPVVF